MNNQQQLNKNQKQQHQKFNQKILYNDQNNSKINIRISLSSSQNLDKNTVVNHQYQSYYAIHKNLKTDLRNKKYQKIYHTLHANYPNDLLYLPLYYQDFIICIIKIIRNSSNLSLHPINSVMQKFTPPPNSILIPYTNQQTHKKQSKNNMKKAKSLNINKTNYQKSLNHRQQQSDKQYQDKKMINLNQQIVTKVIRQGINVIIAFYLFFGGQGNILDQIEGTIKVTQINSSKGKFISYYFSLLIDFIDTLAYINQLNKNYSEVQFIYKRTLVLVHKILQTSTSNVRLISKCVQFLTSYAHFTLSKKNQINFGLILLYRALFAQLNEIYLLNVLQKHKKKAHRIKSKKFKAFHRLKNIYINLAVVFEKIERLQKVHTFLQHALQIQKNYIFPMQQKTRFNLLHNDQRRNQSIQILQDSILNDRIILRKYKEIYDQRKQLLVICQRYFNEKQIFQAEVQTLQMQKKKIQNQKKDIKKNSQKYKFRFNLGFPQILEILTNIVNDQVQQLQKETSQAIDQITKNQIDKIIKKPASQQLNIQRQINNSSSGENLHSTNSKHNNKICQNFPSHQLFDDKFKDYIKQHQSDDCHLSSAYISNQKIPTKQKQKQQLINQSKKARASHFASLDSHKSIYSIEGYILNQFVKKMSVSKKNAESEDNKSQIYKKNDKESSLSSKKRWGDELDDKVLLYGQNFWNINKIKRSFSKASANKNVFKDKKSKSYEDKNNLQVDCKKNELTLNLCNQRENYKQYLKSSNTNCLNRFINQKHSNLQKKSIVKQIIKKEDEKQNVIKQDKKLSKYYYNNLTSSVNSHKPYNIVCDNFQKFQHQNIQFKNFAENKKQKLQCKKENQLDQYLGQCEQELPKNRNDQKILNGFKKKVTKHQQQQFKQKIKATLFISNNLTNEKNKKGSAFGIQDIKKGKEKQKSIFRLKGIQLFKNIVIKHRKQIGISKVELFSNNLLNTGSRIYTQYDSYQLSNQLRGEEPHHNSFSCFDKISQKFINLRSNFNPSMNGSGKNKQQDSNLLINQIFNDIHWKAQKNLNFLINNYYSEINYKTMKNNKKISTVQNNQFMNQKMKQLGKMKEKIKNENIKNWKYKNAQNQDDKYRLLLLNRYDQNPKLFLSSLEKRSRQQ